MPVANWLVFENQAILPRGATGQITNLEHKPGRVVLHEGRMIIPQMSQ
jgi:hypothetical protein